MGLHIDPAHVIRIDAAGWSMKTGYHPMAPEIGYKPMQALLEKSRDFTAIFCFNDIAAIGAIRALKDAGLSVPDDVSVVGFDDILSAAYSTPSLTTVRQPLFEMGKRGAADSARAHRQSRKRVSRGDCRGAGVGRARINRPRDRKERYMSRDDSSAVGLEPPADVDLRMRFAAVVPRAVASAASFVHLKTVNCASLQWITIHPRGLSLSTPQISHR